MISFVSKRLMLLTLLRPLDGSPLLVFSLLRPLVLLTLVARSFCTAPAFLSSTPELDLRGVSDGRIQQEGFRVEDYIYLCT